MMRSWFQNSQHDERMSEELKRDDDDGSPPAKRVRFATTTNTNEATHLAIVTDHAQLRGDNLTYFSPAFTYHAFGKEEQIKGYDNLRIEVLFNAFDFSAWLRIQCKDQETRAEDIRSKLASSLPPDFTEDQEAFVQKLKQDADSDFTPPGTVVSSYQREVDGTEQLFEIYECNLDQNEAAQKLHENLQTLSLWFIEGADGIDVSDPRWVVYIIYERAPSPIVTAKMSFTPVGFVTLFKFRNPLGRKSSSATETHRICQALIFPAYQRQGHCERLVEYIYGQVQANENVYEVTVEDPVPGFSKLRDLVDLAHCKRHNFFSLAPDASTSAPPGHGSASLKPADIEAVQQVLKITQRQVQRCYECFKLWWIDKADEATYKAYRLEVKKRLFKLHAEDLEGMASSERRKAFLDVEFRDLEAHYEQLHSKLNLHL